MLRPHTHEPTQAVRQTFGSPSVLTGCFNVNPLAVRSSIDGAHRRPSYGAVGKTGAGGGGLGLGLAIPRVDTEGLDAVYGGLVGLGPRVVSELWSSIEEVRSLGRLDHSFPFSTVGFSLFFERSFLPLYGLRTPASPPPPGGRRQIPTRRFRAVYG